MTKSSWNVIEILHWTTGFFRRKGISEPRAAAEVLLAHVLGLDRLSLYLNHERPLQADELADFKHCIQRRLRGEPVQYITGSREFWSLSLKVNPAVLIPRPETEHLVEEALAIVPDKRASIHILELGTGSGAVSIALATELAAARLVATDISLAALTLARENASYHGVAHRIDLLCADWFQGLHPATRFHLIISNPPYVSRGQWRDLPREVKDYEPTHALDGGDDGLDAIRHIVPRAPTHLYPGGTLLLEFGADQAEPVERLVAASSLYCHWRLVEDFSGRPRLLVATV